MTISVICVALISVLIYNNYCNRSKQLFGSETQNILGSSVIVLVMILVLLLMSLHTMHENLQPTTLTEENQIRRLEEFFGMDHEKMIPLFENRKLYFSRLHYLYEISNH